MESYKNLFETGDIVWWNEWELVENLGHVSSAQYGAIIKIKIKKICITKDLFMLQ